MSSQSSTDSEKYIKEFLQSTLPISERNLTEEDYKWNFILDKHSLKDEKIKEPRKKKTFLTRKQRKSLNLLKLPKTGWNYQSLEPMRQLWKEYMQKNLNLTKAPSVEDSTFSSFNITVAKSEFIGAELTVIRSIVPNLVGMTGTVVLETKATFQIVNRDSKLKCLLKKPSIFVITVNNIQFTIFGKHLLTRSSERSVKKIKLQLLPDL